MCRKFQTQLTLLKLNCTLSVCFWNMHGRPVLSCYSTSESWWVVFHVTAKRATGNLTVCRIQFAFPCHSVTTCVLCQPERPIAPSSIEREACLRVLQATYVMEEVLSGALDFSEVTPRVWSTANCWAAARIPHDAFAPHTCVFVRCSWQFVNLYVVLKRNLKKFVKRQCGS